MGERCPDCEHIHSDPRCREVFEEHGGLRECECGHPLYLPAPPEAAADRLQETFVYGTVVFTLDTLSQSDAHLRWIIDQHKALAGKDFCEVCSTCTPCDMTSLAASGLARSAQLETRDQEIERLRVTHAEFARMTQEAADMRRERDEYKALALASEGVLIDAPALAVQMHRERDTSRSELQAAVEREAALRSICLDAAEWFERITSGDGSGHADLGRSIRARLASVSLIHKNHADALES